MQYTETYLKICIFLSGSLMMLSFIAGIYFFRFWQTTKDNLFRIFAWSFWSLALERVLLLLFDTSNHEEKSTIYLIRIFSFILLAAAIIQKNRKKSSQSIPEEV